MVNKVSSTGTRCSRRYQIENQIGCQIKQKNIKKETCKSLRGVRSNTEPKQCAEMS